MGRGGGIVAEVLCEGERARGLIRGVDVGWSAPPVPGGGGCKSLGGCEWRTFNSPLARAELTKRVSPRPLSVRDASLAACRRQRPSFPRAEPRAGGFRPANFSTVAPSASVSACAISVRNAHFARPYPSVPAASSALPTAAASPLRVVEGRAEATARPDLAPSVRLFRADPRREMHEVTF